MLLKDLTVVEQRLKNVEELLLMKTDDANLLKEKKALQDELMAVLSSIEEQDTADWETNF